MPACFACSATHIALRSAAMVLLLASARIGLAQESLADRIAAASPGDVIPVPEGSTTRPLRIERSVTLRGISPEQSLLEVTADAPALSATDKAEVTLEAMTIRWQLDSSQPDPGPPTAIYVKDAVLTLRNCRIVAAGNGKRCPGGILADGFSRLSLENCTVEGFEFAVNVSGGAEASVADSVIRKPGHCGLSVFSDSRLSVERCIVAESAFHGLRSTGGILTASDNLIVHNRNRGIYLGNKSAQATIRGNVFLANETGISGFAQTQATIERNVFLDSGYAAIDSRETCLLKIAANVLQGNRRGIVLHRDGDAPYQLKVGSNTFWDNGQDVENLEMPQDALALDPQLVNPEAGQFSAAAPPVVAARHGLSEETSTASLWERWQQLAQPSE